jgi:cellulose synthase/poly-beta-1,6-N-acetylglucosamine synthase-like glycosyltransferase
MERSSLCEDSSSSASQEIINIVWNPGIYVLFHNSQKLAPVLSHMNAFHTLTFCISKIRFDIVGLSKRPLSGFIAKIILFFLFSRMRGAFL